MKDPVDPYKGWMKDGLWEEKEKVEKEVKRFEDGYLGFWSIIAVGLSWERIKNCFMWCWHCFHPEDKGD